MGKDGAAKTTREENDRLARQVSDTLDLVRKVRSGELIVRRGSGRSDLVLTEIALEKIIGRVKRHVHKWLFDNKISVEDLVGMSVCTYEDAVEMTYENSLSDLLAEDFMITVVFGEVFEAFSEGLSGKNYDDFVEKYDTEDLEIVVADAVFDLVNQGDIEEDYAAFLAAKEGQNETQPDT